MAQKQALVPSDAIPPSVVYRSQLPPPVIGEITRSPDRAVTELALASRIRAALGLETLIRSRVIPELAARRAIGGGIHPRAAELANLLLEDAAAPVEALLEETASRMDWLPKLRTTLLEPAARLLGDWWLEDRCTEAEIILGLAILQSAVRRLAGVRAYRAGGCPGRALVALLPGETHVLGAALAADALRDLGWDVAVAFPADADGLLAQLRADPPDALHVALSDVFRREESLPSLRLVIGTARRTCTDRPLRITVGGRIFAERASRPHEVNADGLLPL